MRLWAKAAFTQRNMSASSRTGQSGAVLGVSRTTEEVTFGRGMKHSGGTSKSRSASQCQVRYTVKAP